MMVATDPQTSGVEVGGQEFNLQAFREQIASIPGVKLRDATRAAVCGATGCRSTDALTKVIARDLPDRVLCPRHVLDYVNTRVIQS